MILDEGLPQVLRRHETRARMTRAAMEALGLALFAPDDPAFSCTAVRVPDGLDGKALVKQLKARYDVTVAGGQGRADGVIFRIGHMGDVDGFDMLSVIAAVDYFTQFRRAHRVWKADQRVAPEADEAA